MKHLKSTRHTLYNAWSKIEINFPQSLHKTNKPDFKSIHGNRLIRPLKVWEPFPLWDMINNFVNALIQTMSLSEEFATHPNEILNASTGRQQRCTFERIIVHIKPLESYKFDAHVFNLSWCSLTRSPEQIWKWLNRKLLKLCFTKPNL